MLEITCPTCGHKGSPEDFSMSLADECFCPNGCEWFLMQLTGGDAEESPDDLTEGD